MADRSGAENRAGVLHPLLVALEPTFFHGDDMLTLFPTVGAPGWRQPFANAELQSKAVAQAQKALAA